MEYLIGGLLTLAILAGCTWIGYDRDRALYPAILTVIASYYALFAVMGGSTHALLIECIPIAGFLAAAALGFKRNLWIVIGAFLAHGVFDLVHGRIISNPGVPAWWPGFCLASDIIAAAYLAWLVQYSPLKAKPSGSDT